MACSYRPGLGEVGHSQLLRWQIRVQRAVHIIASRMESSNPAITGHQPSRCLTRRRSLHLGMCRMVDTRTAGRTSLPGFNASIMGSILESGCVWYVWLKGPRSRLATKVHFGDSACPARLISSSTAEWLCISSQHAHRHAGSSAHIHSDA